MRTLFHVALMTVVLGCAAQFTFAQTASENSESKQTSTQKSTEPDQAKGPLEPYRLDFLFVELENGKKINTRHYSLDITTGSTNQQRIGTRVPVPTGTKASDQTTNYQYLETGTTIWANLQSREGALQLEVRGDVDNLDLPTDRDHVSAAPPIVRHINLSGTTLLVTDKPIVIGSMDDPNSNRQFQLEVTATKLR